MFSYKSFTRGLSTVNKQNFNQFALFLFQYQAENNEVYRSYMLHLGINPGTITSIDQVPYIPIQFFKEQTVMTGHWYPEKYFTSSGTSGAKVSRHAVADENVYLANSLRIFTSNYGPPENYHIFALLPSYLEREGSSLISMIEYFLSQSHSVFSGFFLNEYDVLIDKIGKAREAADRKILLFGVSFALLDLAEKKSPDLRDCIVMETGGMKGRRNELTRDELHEILRKSFHVEKIHSEYGMTELYSQAYSSEYGLFHCPPVMKILMRDPYDPFDIGKRNTGAINIIDLANVHSCAFIETQDVGATADEGFRVLGRMDNSDIRGCNLMVE